MDIEEMKREIIERISELQDEKEVEIARKIIEEALRFQKEGKLPEPGWAKGIITYVSDDFDDFIPPGFEESEIFPKAPQFGIASAKRFFAHTWSDRYSRYLLDCFRLQIRTSIKQGRLVGRFTKKAAPEMSRLFCEAPKQPHSLAFRKGSVRNSNCFYFLPIRYNLP